MKVYKKEEYSQFKDVDESTKPLTRCIIKTLSLNYIEGLEEGDIVLYLGEIDNMKGHVAFAAKNGKVFFGYHFDNFGVMPE